MIPYHCDLCDTKFISTTIFEVSNTKQRQAWHQKFFINMIPYHCDICDTKFVSTASFEIQKKETRLEFLLSRIAFRSPITSIGYRGNGEAYTTPIRTLFDRFTLFVYETFVYPSDVYYSWAEISKKASSLAFKVDKRPFIHCIKPTYWGSFYACYIFCPQ